ncbi:hypothetical protein VKT23_009799 [Stygiomarasmius scandens]|uniref:Uncharacterized protein n=1 Tax=Marasmiellus scandens TaxID=2682957 RepID=A0ABR1JG00_9AGAR
MEHSTVLQLRKDLERGIFCSGATFGRRQEDVLDKTYRKAKKLDLQNFATTFDLNSTGIMDVVTAHLLDGSNENDVIRLLTIALRRISAHTAIHRGWDMCTGTFVSFAKLVQQKKESRDGAKTRVFNHNYKRS